jgi:hypothetical protein
MHYFLRALAGAGSPYGGLQVVYLRCVGAVAGTGVYEFGWRFDAKTVSEEDCISS